MDKEDNISVLHHLGRIEGMLISMNKYLESLENNQRRDIENVTVRLNSHSGSIKDVNDRCAAIERTLASMNGQELGKKAIYGLIITTLTLGGGFFVWFLANGFKVLQATGAG